MFLARGDIDDAARDVAGINWLWLLGLLFASDLAAECALVVTPGEESSSY